VDHFYGGGLARAVRPQETEAFAFLYFKDIASTAVNWPYFFVSSFAVTIVFIELQ
jgi:hypothetical protein